jgi:ParB family chromosome partitioning protein
VIPQHLSNSADHQTPGYIIKPARQVLVEFDCDPASCAEANEVVRALTYYAPPFDGLTFDWYGRVLLNPPGGALVMTKKIRDTMSQEEADELAEQWACEAERWKTKSRAVAWWRKLTEEWLEQRTREAIFVGFSLDILQASQGEEAWPDVLKFPLCVPEKRIAFTSNGKPGKMPTHGNVIVYLPHRKGDSTKFEAAFAPLGSVSI